MGLNVDCKPEVLAQYGLIGSIYAEAVLGIAKPRVAVLNIGEEETKGNAQTKATYELLKAETRIHFVGNVEGSYIFSGKVADVIVCDGFVGNTVLKMAEGLYRINKALGCGNAFWDAMNYEKRGRNPRPGRQRARCHRSRMLFAPGDPEHDPSTEQVIKADLTARLQRGFKINEKPGKQEMPMSKKITAAITGVGEYLPEYILTNDELSRMVDTNDEWIMSHIGVKTRHILKGEGGNAPIWEPAR